MPVLRTLVTLLLVSTIVGAVLSIATAFLLSSRSYTPSYDDDYSIWLGHVGEYIICVEELREVGRSRMLIWPVASSDVIAAPTYEEYNVRARRGHEWWHEGALALTQTTPRGAVMLSAAGWPLPVLHGYIAFSDGRGSNDLSFAKGCLVLSAGPNASELADWRLLVYCPLWTNWLVSTWIHGLPVFVVLIGVWACTMYVRLVRNRCVRCAYALKGLPSTTCPECGSQSLNRWWGILRSQVGGVHS
jgi:hypothetical protein